MEHKDYLTRITELSSKISEMPKGYISKKTVSGNIYFYHQWTEGGVKQSRYLHDDEVALLSAQIEERKKLQAELKEVKAEMTRQPKLKQSDEQRIEVTHLIPMKLRENERKRKKTRRNQGCKSSLNLCILEGHI